MTISLDRHNVEAARIYDAALTVLGLASVFNTEAMAAVTAQRDPIVGLFIQALNDVIDLHTTRIQVAVRSRIPRTIWIALFSVAAMGLGSMGYQTGLTGSSRSPAILAVALAFSIVIWLIADLDRTREGMLRVDQYSMEALQRSIAVPPS